MKTHCSNIRSSFAADDDLVATELTFKKITQESIKAGYREGADEARQQNFQQYFDKGFEQGFSNGFNLGILKAHQKLDSNELSDTSIKNHLSKSRQGMCVICKDNEVSHVSLENIGQKQETLLKNIVSQIKGT